MLIFLTDLHLDEAGGAILFPHLHLEVACSRGAGLLWNNVDEDGGPEWRAIHKVSSPVKSPRIAMIVSFINSSAD
jgi:hypothetical protein